jgi:hypothetical protein
MVTQEGFNLIVALGCQRWSDASAFALWCDRERRDGIGDRREGPDLALILDLTKDPLALPKQYNPSNAQNLAKHLPLPLPPLLSSLSMPAARPKKGSESCSDEGLSESTKIKRK